MPPDTKAMTSRLELQDVRSGYGRMEVLHGMTLAIEPGEFVAVVGANGAGKSVLLKTVAGILKCWDGTIRFGGKTVSGLRASEVQGSGVTFIPQSAITFPRMSVEENLRMGAFVESDRTVLARRFEQVYALAPELFELRKRLAGNLSGGQQKMLALGRALMSEPELLLFDEPSIGLDPKALDRVFTKLRELNAQGLTVVLVEQNVRMALKVASRAVLLELGNLRFSGTPAELLADEALERAYFGVRQDPVPVS